MPNTKKVMRIKKKTSDKTIRADATFQVLPDRVSCNLSFEPFNGCWVGFGYESDVIEGETLEQCRDRVFEFVNESVTEKAEEFVSQNEEG